MPAASVPAGHYRPHVLSCWLVTPDTAEWLEHVPHPHPNLNIAVFKNAVILATFQILSGHLKLGWASGAKARSKCFPRPLAQHLTATLLSSRYSIASVVFALLSVAVAPLWYLPVSFRFKRKPHICPAFEPGAPKHFCPVVIHIWELQAARTAMLHWLSGELSQHSQLPEWYRLKRAWNRAAALEMAQKPYKCRKLLKEM